MVQVRSSQVICCCCCRRLREVEKQLMSLDNLQPPSPLVSMSGVALLGRASGAAPLSREVLLKSKAEMDQKVRQVPPL